VTARLNTTIVVYNESEILVPSEDMVVAVLAKYGVTVNEAQIYQIRRYIACLVYWNQRVSLTSVTTPMEIVERHFAESMFGASFLRQEESRLADVGAGPGFPGLALKIALPSLRVLLIERNAKKCAFLNEVTRLLDLNHVTVIRADYGSISPKEGYFDYITARALGGHKDLLRWAAERLKPDGEIILWLGVQDSLKLSQIRGWRWDPPIAIPQSQRRVILAGRPIP